jgi:hypothetical protein
MSKEVKEFLSIRYRMLILELVKKSCNITKHAGILMEPNDHTIN